MYPFYPPFLLDVDLNAGQIVLASEEPDDDREEA